MKNRDLRALLNELPDDLPIYIGVDFRAVECTREHVTHGYIIYPNGTAVQEAIMISNQTTDETVAV